MELNQTTIDSLVNQWGYVATEAGYEITVEDVAKMLGENATYIKADVNGDGKLDIVPYTGQAPATVSVTVKDGFPESEASTQNVCVGTYPYCPAKDGYVFEGWVDEQGVAVTAADIAEGSVLIARWRVEMPEEVKAEVLVEGNPAGISCEIMPGTSYSLRLTNYLDEDSYTYQWYHDETLIPGEVHPELQIPITTLTISGEEAGWHHYTCEVTSVQRDGFSASINEIAISTTVRVKVLKNYVALIQETGKKYDTLTAAVADANGMEKATIELLQDIEQSEPLEITGKDVTIVGEYTINWADNTKTLFTVKPGAALTLDGKVTLDGGNNWVLDSDLYNMYLNAKDPAGEDSLKNAVTKDVNGIDMYPVTSENGKSDFGATADMILNQGTLNVNNATIENFFSFKVYYNSRDNYAASSGSVVIRSDSESVTNLNKGSVLQHNASGTGGVIVNVEGQKNWVNYYTEVNVDGATVQNNFAGSNGGMFKVYHATLNIKDGYIYNNKATDANGSVVMLYGGDAILNLYGGEICSNSSAYGYNNGRTAALYFHASSVFNMYGGTICHNTGFSRGGLYLNYNVADINIYGTPVSEGSKFNTGVEIIDNANVRGDATKDIYSGPAAAMYFDIYGGIYTQDVDEWCAPGYVCIPYEESERTDDFIVVPGYRVLYYSIDGVNDETGEVTTTLVHKELLALDGQEATEVDLYATPYQAYVGDTNQIISKWYTDVEMTNQWSYKTEVEADTKLYGEWKEDKSVCMIVETGIRYETLAEGVADANDMGKATVKVLQDIYQAEPLTITGEDITMIGEYTIYRDENAVEASKDGNHADTDFVPGDQAYYWDLFTVAENAMFTLDGGIVLDGNNNWTLGEYDAEKDGYSPVGEEGKPRAGNGAYMIQNNGTLYVLDATLQNQYGNHDYGKGFSGAINVGNNSVTTLDGATIKHIASNDGGTAVFMQNGSNAVLNIKGDTLITDIYGGANASIIRAYGTDTINMSGGTISNCYCDYYGSLMYFYSGCTMNFTGGIIKDNWGNGNGVFYLHSGTVFNMEGAITEDGTVTGGIIEGNTFYTSAIYGNSGASSLKISGGKIYDNVATYNSYAAKDYNDFYATQSYTKITGGIYTQDVDKWCAPGYVCIPFDKTERTDDFIVVPGYRVSYYAIEQGEYGSAPTTKLVGSEVLLIPVGKHADEVDLFATPYYPVVTEPGRTIEKWYLDTEMTTQWSYETEILENVALYGDWKYSLEVNMTESGFKEIIQDNNVKVELYQVTDPAVLQKLAELTTAEDWMAQALEVKALTDGKTLVAEGITSQGVWECGYLSAGLYLVDAQQVQTAYNQYDFVPYLIYLPHSYAADDAWFEITEDSSVVRVTPTKIERKGDLEIIKRLNVYNETLEGASFVFQVEGVKKDIDTGRDIVVYSDVLLLTFQEPGVARMVLTDIPAGSVVTVTEIYTGSNYELATDESVTVTVEAKKVDDQGFVNKAEFINTHNRSIKGGTGSVTRFTFDGETWSHQTTVNTAQ